MPVKQGNVLYFASEDHVKELRRREDRITHYLQSIGQYEPRAQSFKIVPLVGKDTILAKWDSRTGVVAATKLFESVRRMINEFKPDLVIVGNRVNIFAVNQIDDTQALQCLNLLHAITIKFDCSVIMPSHPSLRGISSGEGTSGSVQWENGCRQRVYFSRIIEKGEKKGDEEEEPDRNARMLAVKKANWAPDDKSMAVHWDKEFGLFVSDDIGVTEAGKPQPRQPVDWERIAEDEFLRLLDQLPPGATVSSAITATNNAVKIFSQARDCRVPKKDRKHLLQEAMERLFKKEIIDAPNDGPPSRKAFKIVRKG